MVVVLLLLLLLLLLLIMMMFIIITSWLVRPLAATSSTTKSTATAKVVAKVVVPVVSTSWCMLFSGGRTLYKPFKAYRPGALKLAPGIASRTEPRFVCYCAVGQKPKLLANPKAGCLPLQDL